jgi:hypothetical protein
VRAAATAPLPLTVVVKEPWLTVAVVVAVTGASRDGSHQKIAPAMSARISGSKSQRWPGTGCFASERSRVRGKGTVIRIVRILLIGGIPSSILARV